MDKISAKCFIKTYRYFKTLTSLRKRLAAEKLLPDRQFLQVAVNREKSLNLQGITGITIIFKSERDNVKLK